MAFAIFGVVSILACWKWGDWKHWQLYYPTLLYLLIGDLVADFLLCSHGLWGFGEFIEKYPILDISIMILIYPPTVILFLTRFPAKPVGQALRVLLWMAIYVCVEIIACHTGGCSYHNGWSIWYSIVFDTVMFPLLLLHFKKPLLVWPISAAMCLVLLWWFRVPLARQ